MDEVREGPCQLEVEKPIQAEMEEVYKSPLQPGALDKTCGGTKVLAPDAGSRGSRPYLQGHAGSPGGQHPD